MFEDQLGARGVLDVGLGKHQARQAVETLGAEKRLYEAVGQTCVGSVDEEIRGTAGGIDVGHPTAGGKNTDINR